MKFVSSSPGLKYRLIIIGILLLAFGLRLVAIDKIPAGLSHDEAYNGITAIQVLDGERQIFFEINKGIEPLIIYLEAIAFHWLGIGPAQMRLVNVFFGLLTVALIYPLAARLFYREVALLAMAGLAVSFWGIFTSRLSLRATLFPPILLITLYFFWRGLNPGVKNHPWQPFFSLAFFVLSGLAAGLVMYTYLASRFVPLLLLAIFGYYLLSSQLTKTAWLGLFLHLLIWTAIFAPLADYYLDHAESFTRRADQVSTLPHALEGDFGPLAKNTWRTLGMFTFQGDTTDRYNLNGRPVFDWVNGLLFYLGLGIVAGQVIRRPLKANQAVILLGMLFFMLLPDFITDDSPHFLRTIGAMPGAYILWGLGLFRMSQWLSGKKIERRSPLQNLFGSQRGFLFVASVLTLTTIHTSFDYFQRWATAPEARYIYGADIAEVAHYLKATSEGDLAVISAEYYRDLDPFRFALHFQGRPPFVIWFDGTQSLAFPPQGSPLSLRYIFPNSAPPADIWADFLRPVPEESGQEYRLYRLHPQASLAQFEMRLNPINVNLQDDLILSGYQILDEVVSGGQTRVLLAWQALRGLPPGTDYTFLVQLRDRQQHLWVEVDGNGYDADDWQPGVPGLQLLTLRLPGDLPPQTYQVTVEVINRQTGQALTTSLGETKILLAAVEARLAPHPREIDPDRLPNPIPITSLNSDKVPPLALRGYQLNPRAVQAGDEISLTFHWQIVEQPQSDYRLLLYLQNHDQTKVYEWPSIEPINGQWPTQEWPAHYWVQDKLSLPVGPAVPTGTFNLRVTWIEVREQSSSNTSELEGFELGSIKIGPGE